MRYIRRHYGEEAWQQYLRGGKKWEGRRKKASVTAVRPVQASSRAAAYRHEFRKGDDSIQVIAEMRRSASSQPSLKRYDSQPESARLSQRTQGHTASGQITQNYTTYFVHDAQLLKERQEELRLNQQYRTLKTPATADTRDDSYARRVKELENDAISYRKLCEHIQNNHPRTTEAVQYLRKGAGAAKAVTIETTRRGPKFGICEPLGSNAWCQASKDHETSELAHEIGIAATLFLKGTKSMSWLFLILTIINIPVYMFFYSSNPASAQLLSLADYFAATSLGNLGESQQACDVINWAVAKEVTLSCSQGLLTDLKYVGVSQDDEISCLGLLSANRAADLLLDGCFHDVEDVAADGWLNDEGNLEFMKQYELNCRNKQSCTLPLKPAPTASYKKIEIKKTCQKVLDDRQYHSAYATASEKNKLGQKVSQSSRKATPSSVVEPWFIAMAKCQQDVVQVKLYPIPPISLQKEDFGIVVVFIDFLCVILVIRYIGIVDARQKEFAFEEKEQTMQDYTLVLRNLPLDGAFSGNEHVLRAVLWAQMDEIIKDQWLAELEHRSPASRFSDEEKALYSVVDITFGRSIPQEVTDLHEINELRFQKMKQAVKQRKLYQAQVAEQNPQFVDAVPQMPAGRLAALNGETNEAIGLDDYEREKYSRLARQAEKDLSALEEKYTKLVTEYKRKYDPHREEYYQKDEKFKAGRQTIRRAYIVFRSNRALELAKRAFDYTWLERFRIRWCWGSAAEREAVDLRYFAGRWVAPMVPQPPERIRWKNMGVSPACRCCVRSFNYIIATLLFIIAFIGIVYFQNLSVLGTSSDYVTQISGSCPATVSKQSALFDHKQEDIKSRQGLLHCYCIQEMWQHPKDFLNTKFDDVASGDETLYCQEWAIALASSVALEYGAPAVIIIINQCVPMIFQWLAELESSKIIDFNKNNEILGAFRKITILQYFDIAIIILLVNMNFGVKDLLMNAGLRDFLARNGLGALLNFPVLAGEYDDFSARWYRNVGAALCFTLCVNVLSPQLASLVEALLELGKRLRDRRCRTKLSAGADKCFTEQLLQSDLQAIYEGPEVDGHYVYAQFYTAIWAILSYSSSMPILYPIGALNFLFLHYVYKCLLIKYYRKTESFNQDLAIKSMSYFKIAVVQHLIFGAYMYSNSNILSTKNVEWLHSFNFLAKTQDPAAPASTGGLLTSIDRFRSGIGLLYLIFVGLVLLFYVLREQMRFLAFLLIRAIFLCECSLSSKSLNAQIDDVEFMEPDGKPDCEDILVNFGLTNLQGYYHRVKKEHVDFAAIDGKLFDFDLTLQKYVKQQMKERLAAIDGVVEQYMEILKGEVAPESADELAGLDTAEKLRVLLCNWDILKDSGMITAMKLTGKVQSYALSDSKVYTDSLFMRDEIRREMDSSKATKRNPTVNSLLLADESRNHSVLSASKDSWLLKDLVKQNAQIKVRIEQQRSTLSTINSNARYAPNAQSQMDSLQETELKNNLDMSMHSL